MKEFGKDSPAVFPQPHTKLVTSGIAGTVYKFNKENKLYMFFKMYLLREPFELQFQNIDGLPIQTKMWVGVFFIFIFLQG